MLDAIPKQKRLIIFIALNCNPQSSEIASPLTTGNPVAFGPFEMAFRAEGAQKLPRLKAPASTRHIVWRLLPILWLGASVVVMAQTSRPKGGVPPLVGFSAHESGVPTAAITSILQDPAGVMFFATRSLLQYDGERWVSTNPADTHSLQSIAFGGPNLIWAGGTSEFGWFSPDHTSVWHFHSLRGYLPAGHAPGAVWHVYGDGHTATFITENSVVRWDGTQLNIWPMPGGRRLYGSQTGNRIFVHHPPSGLHEVTAKGLQLVIPQNVLGDAPVIWSEAGPRGLLLGTSNGFFRYEGGKLSQVSSDVDEFLQRERMTCAIRLHDGRIVVGTLRGGILLLTSDGKFERSFGAEDLSSTLIYSLFVDRDGALWAGTAAQLVRIDLNSRAALFDSRHGLPQVAVRKIAKAADRLVVATEIGLFSTANESHFSLVEGTSGGIHSLTAAAKGLFIAGYKGIAYWDGARVLPFFASEADSFAIAPARTNARLHYLVANRSLLETQEGFPARLLAELPAVGTSLAEDWAGRLWLATAGHGLLLHTVGSPGVTRADGESATFGLPTLKSRLYVRALGDGSLFAIAKEGVWILGRGQTRFNPVKGYTSRPIVAVSPVGSDKAVWLLHPLDSGTGIAASRIEPGGNHASASLHVLDSTLQAATATCVYAEPTDRHTADGTVLWIGGSHGLFRTVVDSSLAQTAPRSPKLHAIARVGTANEVRVVGDILPAETRSIELQFATLEFSRRSAVRLESRIEGIDSAWMAVGKGAFRELAAPRDGVYQARVRAVSYAGATSPETRLSFEILPPWWRTRTALVLEAIGILAVVVGGYRFRVRSLRRQNAILEAKVRERTEELERASAAKTEFVANMSHDIRNPLNGIVGLALALEDTRLDSRQQEIVATLRECTTYLSSLVDDVLDFASIEAGKVDLRPAAFSPADLLQSIVATLKADTAERGARLHVECDANLPRALMGDAGRIQQILVNYVSNALKYAGGEITLRAAVPAKSPGEIEFSVADRGPGISRDEQRELFTKFSRLAGARRDDIPGTGLGLAACRHLADLMGGSVGVVSEPGAGARFFLRLPRTVAQESPAAASTTMLPNTAVLLVEDTDYNAWAATAVLAKLGLTCDRARNGEEAIRLFGQRRYNVVLLDRNLPDMDGMEVARQLRALEADGPSALLLAVTAYCTAEDKQKCLDAGMDAFVGKPLTPEKLRRVLIAAGRRMLATATLQAEPDLAPPPAAPALDTSLFDYIADETDPDGLNTQLHRFLEHLEETAAELRRASAARDHRTLASAAHRMLGQARMIGCAALVNVVTALEEAACAGNASACSELVQQMQGEIAALTEALRCRTTSSQPA